VVWSGVSRTGCGFCEHVRGVISMGLKTLLPHLADV
jgi:hypothetical protein